MIKKEIVREYLEAMKDKGWFTVSSLATQLKVEGKDVHNAMAPYLANGSMQKEKEAGSKHCIYRKVGNVAAAVKLKQDPPPVPGLITPKKVTDHTDTPRRQAKRRTPFVMAIDAEIKALELKVKNLRSVRKEFE